MDNALTSFETLKVAASSPLAMFGYLAGLVASGVLIWRVRRNQNLLARIRDIPGKDRKAALQAEMGIVLPKSISAEQWLRSRLYQYYFLGFVAVIVCVTLVMVIAFGRTVGAAESGAAANTIAANQVAASGPDQPAVQPAGQMPPQTVISDPPPTEALPPRQPPPPPQAAAMPNRIEVWRATSISESDPELSISLLGALLSRGFDVNGAIDGEGNRALHLAAERCSARVVNWLLAQGADPSIPNTRYRETALRIADIRCGANNAISAALRPH